MWHSLAGSVGFPGGQRSPQEMGARLSPCGPHLLGATESKSIWRNEGNLEEEGVVSYAESWLGPQAGPTSSWACSKMLAV